jgi:phage protein D
MSKTVVDRPDFSDLVPRVVINVEGTELTEDITRYVVDVEVELTRDIADMISMTVINPFREASGLGELGGQQTGSFLFLDDTTFQPGNRIDIFMGYADATEHIASGIIQRWMPNFPESGMPVLQLKAYDHSTLLMEGEGTMAGGAWSELTHDAVVSELVKRYNINQLVADTAGEEPVTIKKHGMTDYAFVKGLANLHGYYFKVRFDVDSNEPIAYWGESATVFPSSDTQYTFTYGAGDDSTLLSFEPQFAIRDIPSKVEVLYFDPDTKTWEQVPVEEDDETGELKYSGDGSLPEEPTLEQILSSSAYRITAGGKSVEVVPERRFQSAEAAQRWAERWIRSRKDNFITATGRVIGLETLRPGQVHVIEGVGTQLSGEYEMTSVRHIFDGSSGYVCEFFAHKVLS